MTTGTVLVLNAGSSSLKAAVLQVDDQDGLQRLWQGQQSWSPGPEAICSLAPWLVDAIGPWRGALTLVAHRVVHGGERFAAPTRLDGPVRAAIDACTSLAPLHNAAALALIDWLQPHLETWQPGLEHWVCFDTAFHQSLAAAQFTYAIPQSWRQQGLRRYGFHGLNHQHLAETVAQIVEQEGASSDQLGELRLISAHLGAGCSLCAIKGGRSVATSMGLTPLDGLVMATRSGSIDPGLLLHQLQHGGLSSAQLNDALNHHSGLLGLSGLSADLRELRQAAMQGHQGAQLAVQVFMARLLEGIGAMAAVLHGVDVIALSGGIGENDDALAHQLMQELHWLGPFRLLQIPADEEGQMARQCLAQRRDRGAQR